jgi:hypothetical protein
VKTVLFVNHKEQKCGVYQYGKNTIDTLRRSTEFHFEYAECSNMEQLNRLTVSLVPYVVIYNYHVSTLGWVRRPVGLHMKHIAIQHEPHQPVPGWMDAVISQDPLEPESENHFSVSRILHKFTGTLCHNAVFTVGTFGFGMAGKGFDRLVDMVCDTWDEAYIRMHIPYAHFGDMNGAQARDWAARARNRVSKPGVFLNIDHAWFDTAQLLQFLANNDLNAFLYDDMARGVASVLDFALSVPRPLAITSSSMFKHVWKQVPEICVEQNSLIDIVIRGTKPLETLYDQWAPEKLIADYERIVRTVCPV